MAFDPAALLAHRFAPLHQAYEPRDAILYALGLGLGRDPLDARDLDYLIETRGKVLPSFAATLASPGMWIRDPRFGVDFARLVHAEQAMTFHQPLPPAARVVATPRIAGLYDRGEGRGAVLIVERDIADAETHTSYATARQTLLLRGDGGFGGNPPPATLPIDPPQRAPDRAVTLEVSSRAALIYRLSGDWNPLHCDPELAQRAGFERPILHGLASFGMAADAAMRAFGDDLAALSCRFSGVVYPGDTLDFTFWQTDRTVCFTAARDGRIVLDRGLLELH